MPPPLCTLPLLPAVRLLASAHAHASARCAALCPPCRYCSRLGICLGACKFLLRGSRVFGASTPLSLRVREHSGVGQRAGQWAAELGGVAAPVSAYAGPTSGPHPRFQPWPPPTTPQMKDGDELTAVPESADRLRTAAELGPLFAQIFGADAAKGVPADLPL